MHVDDYTIRVRADRHATVTQDKTPDVLMILPVPGTAPEHGKATVT